MMATGYDAHSSYPMNGGPGSHPRARAASLSVSILPLLGRCHRIFNRPSADLTAVGALEDSQVRTVAT